MERNRLRNTNIKMWRNCGSALVNEIFDDSLPNGLSRITCILFGKFVFTHCSLSLVGLVFLTLTTCDVVGSLSNSSGDVVFVSVGSWDRIFSGMFILLRNCVGWKVG